MSASGLIGLGVIVTGLLMAAPALAVSVDLDRGKPTPAAPADKSKPEYSFTGNGFHFSISRTPSAPEDTNRSDDKTQPRTERTWLERVQRFIDDIIGD